MRFRGIIDRISRAKDGAIEIHDFKTSARVPSQQELDEDRQLALYQIALARTRGTTEPVRLVWHYVRPGIVRTSERAPDALRALESATLDVVERIRSEKEFAPVPGRLCAWCEYRDGCSASPVRRTDVPAYVVKPALAAATVPVARLAPRAARASRRAAACDAQLALPLL